MFLFCLDNIFLRFGKFLKEFFKQKLRLLESEENPWALINSVCSPGGTTIEGIATLQKENFDTAVMNAVQSSYEKDKKL